MTMIMIAWEEEDADADASEADADADVDADEEDDDEDDDDDDDDDDDGDDDDDDGDDDNDDDGGVVMTGAAVAKLAFCAGLFAVAALSRATTDAASVLLLLEGTTRHSRSCMNSKPGLWSGVRG